MSEYIYRYRSIERILDELSNNKIYFSDPKKLNDPFEDFKDIFWEGDKILWENLFKNYILSLFCFREKMISDGADHPTEIKEKKEEKSINVFVTFDTLPASICKNRMQKIFDEFFSNKKIVWFLDYVSSRRQCRKDEIIVYLEAIHLYCIQLMDKYDETIKDQDKILSEVDDSLESNLYFDIDEFKRIRRRSESNKIPENFNEKVDSEFKKKKYELDQIKLVTVLYYREFNKRNDWFYLFSFPSSYVKQLERLMFCPWYTACFSKDSRNHLMWSHYASGHQGICLKFKSKKYYKNYSDGLILNLITEHHENTKEIPQPDEQIFLTFNKIKYKPKLRPIDFFRTLGQLKPENLIKEWYTDDNGVQSPLAEELLDSFEKRQDPYKKYWKKFHSDILLKIEDWEYEDEMRLVHVDTFSKIKVKQNLFFLYDFKDLEGIIFGLNTSETEKIDIFEIIKNKCEAANRKDFKFSQAAYDIKTGKIKIYPLDTMKFIK